jgi:hypothetical protein
MTTDIFAGLAAEFPRNAVSWRCQTLTKGGDKGLALAYIDARDVMRRLDAVLGPAAWQDRYEVHGSKTLCYISILIDGHWITKADGAGDTDVEAEKGSISDAFKRAAVKWGIGRYLYDIESPWVPCESHEKNGKQYWRRWTADPWSCVRGSPPARPAPANGNREQLDPFGLPPLKPRLTFAQLEDMFSCAETIAALKDLAVKHAKDCEALSVKDQEELRRAYTFRAKALKTFHPEAAE